MPNVGRTAPDKTHTQSVLIDKDKYSLTEAKKWIKDHNYYVDGLDETDKLYRFRQYDPNEDKFNYRIQNIETGINLVIGYLKNEKGLNMKYKVLIGKEVNQIKLIPGDIIKIDEITASTLEKEGVIERYEGDIEQEKKSISELVEKKVKQIKEKELNMTIEVKQENLAPMSLFDFMGKVKSATLGDVKSHEELEKRQLVIKTTLGQNITTNEDGGYLLPAEIAKEVLDVIPSRSVIYPKCSKIPITGKNISLPAIYETSRTISSFKGGIRTYVVSEGADITPFKQAINTVTITPFKFAAAGYITGELEMDCPSYKANLIKNVGEAFGETWDAEILSAGKSAFVATIGHASVADVTIAAAVPTASELSQMFAAVENPAGAEWFMGSVMWSKLMDLKTGTAGYPLIQPNYQLSPFGTLLGRPINICKYMSAVNTVGDILFADFASYQLVSRGNMRFDESIEVAFLTDQKCMRFIQRMGGSPMLKSTVTYPDGSTLGWASERA